MSLTIPRARKSDPHTSHAAAASIKDLRRAQEDVLFCFKQYGKPMTDTELIAEHKRWVYVGQVVRQSDSGLRTRRKELVTKFLVEDSGLVDILPSGRKSIKWKAI